MAFLTMPLSNDLPWYRFKIVLSGQIFTCRARYNTRMQRWMLDVADPTNADILNSVPLLILRDLLGQYVGRTLPIGKMFVTDDTNTDTQPTRLSFGVESTLYYEDPNQ